MTIRFLSRKSREAPAARRFRSGPVEAAGAHELRREVSRRIPRPGRLQHRKAGYCAAALPSGSNAIQVIEQSASLGVLVAPGEPFFIRPGRVDVLRLNAGAVSADRAVEVASALAKAALTHVETPAAAIPV